MVWEDKIRWMVHEKKHNLFKINGYRSICSSCLKRKGKVYIKKIQCIIKN